MKAWVLVAALCAASAVAAPKKKKLKTIQGDFVDGMVAITFDPKRISEEDVRAAFRFKTDDQIAVRSECQQDGENDTFPDKENPYDAPEVARSNLAFHRCVLAKQEARKVPKGLEALGRHRIELAKWQVAISEARLAFAEKLDVTVLEKPVRGLDVKTECASVIESVREAKDKYYAAFFEWGRCVNHLAQEKIGGGQETEDMFKEFLTKYGITREFPSDC